MRKIVAKTAVVFSEISTNNKAIFDHMRRESESELRSSEPAGVWDDHPIEDIDAETNNKLGVKRTFNDLVGGQEQTSQPAAGGSLQDKRPRLE